jgi:hexosaminidase
MVYKVNIMKYRLDFAVLEEKENRVRFGLTLHNLSDYAIADWTLNFVFDRFIQTDTVTNGQLKQIGSYCVLTPDANQALEANNHFYFEYEINSTPFRFLSDGLHDAFIHHNNEIIAVDITPIVLASPYTEREFIPEVLASKAPIVPQPNFIEALVGEFVFNSSCAIQVETDVAQSAADWFIEETAHLFTAALPLSASGNIVYTLNPILDAEEYKLQIDKTEITLEASSVRGFINATASLLQLTPATAGSDLLTLPCLTIKDQPRYDYRGLMLDCSRHFHSIEQVKRLINQLAQLKFNTFHWHFTDDEGWRLEIDAFPELTQVGGWRGIDEALEPQFTTIKQKIGGYYTKADVRDVIDYASKRGIQIIPEIDIPGHCRAAIKSLPHLLVDEDDHSQYCSIQNYTDNILSPALPGTYEFLDKVIEEVAELFPSEFIHLGADEVPDNVWTASEKCKVFMAEHGYTDTKELQGHLLRYAEKKLKSLGKRMVGWEEAQHGDKVSKDTVIYSWRDEKAALFCAKQGYDVVLQPAQTTYLDIVQDFAPDEPGVDWSGVLPLEVAYRYETLNDLTEDDPIRKRVLGIQCALWCEIINHQARIDYMLFPRLYAVAEAAWTEKPNKDWIDFLSRLKGQLPHLDRQGVNYRNPWKSKES